MTELKKVRNSVFSDEFSSYLEENFFDAVKSNNLEKLKRFSNTFNANTSLPCGLTGLMIASREGFIEVVRFFVNSSTHLTTQDKQGKDALMYAKENGHTEIVKLLEREILYFYKYMAGLELRGSINQKGYTTLYRQAKRIYKHLCV